MKLPDTPQSLYLIIGFIVDARTRVCVFLSILCNVYMNLFASLKCSFYVFFHFIRVLSLALQTTTIITTTVP